MKQIWALGEPPTENFPEESASLDILSQSYQGTHRDRTAGCDSCGVFYKALGLLGVCVCMPKSDRMQTNNQTLRCLQGRGR